MIASGVYDKPGVAHLDLVQSLRFSPDSNLLVSGGYRNVKLWRRAANARRMTFSDFGSQPRSVAVKSNGTTLAIGEANGAITKYAGAAVETLAAHSGPVTGLAYASADQHLVSASLDGTFKIWADSPEPLVTVETTSPVHCLAVWDDQVATGGEDGIIRVWQISSRKMVAELSGHVGAVTSLAAAGASQLLSGGQDGTVRQWNVTDSKLVRNVDHGAPVAAVALSQESKAVRLGRRGWRGAVVEWRRWQAVGRAKG